MNYQVIGCSMPASALIKHLEDLIDKYGDGEVLVSYEYEMEFHYLDFGGS